MEFTRYKPAFDNGAFQVYLIGQDVEFNFGDEYSFSLSELLKLLDFLRSMGVRLE